MVLGRIILTTLALYTTTTPGQGYSSGQGEEVTSVKWIAPGKHSAWSLDYSQTNQNQKLPKSGRFTVPSDYIINGNLNSNQFRKKRGSLDYGLNNEQNIQRKTENTNRISAQDYESAQKKGGQKNRFSMIPFDPSDYRADQKVQQAQPKQTLKRLPSDYALKAKKLAKPSDYRSNTNRNIIPTNRRKNRLSANEPPSDYSDRIAKDIELVGQDLFVHVGNGSNIAEQLRKNAPVNRTADMTDAPAGMSDTPADMTDTPADENRRVLHSPPAAALPAFRREPEQQSTSAKKAERKKGKLISSRDGKSSETKQTLGSNQPSKDQQPLNSAKSSKAQQPLNSAKRSKAKPSVNRGLNSEAQKYLSSDHLSKAQQPLNLSQPLEAQPPLNRGLSSEAQQSLNSDQPLEPQQPLNRSQPMEEAQPPLDRGLNSEAQQSLNSDQPLEPQLPLNRSQPMEEAQPPLNRGLSSGVQQSLNSDQPLEPQQPLNRVQQPSVEQSKNETGKSGEPEFHRRTDRYESYLLNSALDNSTTASGHKSKGDPPRSKFTTSQIFFGLCMIMFPELGTEDKGEEEEEDGDSPIASLLQKASEDPTFPKETAELKAWVMEKGGTKMEVLDYLPTVKNMCIKFIKIYLFTRK